MRHRVDGPGSVRAFARAGMSPGARKRLSHDRLDAPAIGRRRQSVTNAKIHAEDTELEIRHREQGVLLIGKVCKVPDLAKISIIFETYEQIRPQFSCQACRGRKALLTKFSEADIDDRVEDEFVVRVANADDGPDLHSKPC